jgi:hypothetical protein
MEPARLCPGHRSRRSLVTHHLQDPLSVSLVVDIVPFSFLHHGDSLLLSMTCRPPQTNRRPLVIVVLLEHYSITGELPLSADISIDL